MSLFKFRDGDASVEIVVDCTTKGEENIYPWVGGQLLNVGTEALVVRMGHKSSIDLRVYNLNLLSKNLKSF